MSKNDFFPCLPLRDIVVFPGMIVPLFVGRDKSIKALNEEEFKAMDGEMNMGQIAVACALGYLDFRHNARQWRSGHSNLASWNEKMIKLPALIKTIPTD